MELFHFYKTQKNIRVTLSKIKYICNIIWPQFLRRDPCHRNLQHCNSVAQRSKLVFVVETEQFFLFGEYKINLEQFTLPTVNGGNNQMKGHNYGHSI